MVASRTPPPARRLWRLTTIAGVVALIAIGALALTNTSPAAADIPTDPTPSCRGTTTDESGAPTTPAPGTIHLTGAYLARYQSGEPVTLYNNLGSRAFTDGGLAGASAIVPACAVRSIDGVAVADWLYCTDEALYACNDAPSLSGGQPDTQLTVEEQRQIASLLAAAHGGPLETSTRGRAMIQVQVWCISESVAPGSVNSSAQSYFNTGNRLPPGDDLTAAEATCAPPPAVASPATVSAAAALPSVPAGSVAPFVVRPSVPGTITLSLTSGVAALCATDTSGATLAGLQLTAVGADVPIQVCVTTPSVGVHSLTARLDSPSLDGFWAWTGVATCQHFVGHPRALDAVVSTASIDVQPGSATVDPTSAAPTTTGASPTTTAAPDGSERGTTNSAADASPHGFTRGSSSGGAGQARRGSPTSTLPRTGGTSALGEVLVASGIAVVGMGLLVLRRR